MPNTVSHKPPDEPLMVAASRVKDLELFAIREFRKRYPEAPPWQELADSTRVIWMRHCEETP